MAELRYPPGDYRYREVPDWATSYASEENYKRYCQWLAEHLRQGTFALSPLQAEYVKRWKGKDPESMVLDLAETLGYSIFDRDILEMQAEQGIAWEVIEKEWAEAWERDKVDLKGFDPEEFADFEAEATIYRADYEGICRQVAEQAELGEVPGHADIPYRPLLAYAAGNCSDPAEVASHIENFYHYFNEASQK